MSMLDNFNFLLQGQIHPAFLVGSHSYSYNHAAAANCSLTTWCARYVRVGVAELLDTSEGGAVMSRCGFRSVCYLEVKICCKNALEPRIVSAVRSLEVVASRRLPVYYKYGIFNL